MKIEKLICLILTLCIVFSFAACSLYDKEYLAVTDYAVATPSVEKAEDKTVVTSYSGLKKSVEELVTRGESSGRVVLSETYQGNAESDIATACWQVKSRNALCAYCVKDISYELTKIVNYYEADISVAYADTGVPFEEIHQIPRSTGLNAFIRSAIDKGDKKLVVLVNNGTLTVDGISGMVSSYYAANPMCAPKEPGVNVQVYSGEGNQKLYNITFNYGMSDEKLALEKEELSYIKPFDGQYSGDKEKFNAMADYLSENCILGEGDTVYDALVNKEGSSKALAYATVALCNEIGLDSRFVEGQMRYASHYWNLVKINGNFYHFDPSTFLTYGRENSWLRTDSEIWNEYRWDTSSYPACSEPLAID